MSATTDYPALCRDLRAAHGWTQQQLGDQIGATAASVGGWERGKCLPSHDYTVKLDHLAAKTATRKNGARKNGARRPGAVGFAEPADADTTHAAIMADGSLTQAQRSAIAALRLAFKER